MAVVPNRIARVARLGTSLRSRPLLCALLISAVLAAGFVLLLNPGYETNDDVGMQWVVDGTQGRPLPHLVFGNVLVGLVLRTLYRAVDWFPWYGLYLYLVHWAALLAVVYLVLADRRDRAWVRFTALGGILALFHLSMWMELQFTSAALLLGTSGLVLYAATSATRRGPGRSSPPASWSVSPLWCAGTRCRRRRCWRSRCWCSRCAGCPGVCRLSLPGRPPS